MSDSKLIPYKAIHPGSILKDELTARGIKQKDFAKSLGLQASNLSRLLCGNSPITISLANKLESVLGIPAEHWVRLQSQYEKDKELIKQRDSEENNYNSLLSLLSKIINIHLLIKKGLAIEIPVSFKKQYELIKDFLQIKKPSDVQLLVDKAGNFRRTDSKAPDTLNLATWICIVHGKTKSVKLQKELSVDRAREELSRFFNDGHNDCEGISDILTRNGIIYIEVPHLKGTYVDGYSFLREDGTPVIATSRRFSRQHDRIAFYVMHELGHVALHLNAEENTEAYISIDGYSKHNKEEAEANDYAANALIDKETWNKIINNDFKLKPSSIKKIIAQQCQKYQINYDIAIGRYKHEMNNYKF